jgi:hypothetical protein
MQIATHSISARAPNAIPDPPLIDRAIDLLEQEAFQLDIITSFEERGWALYEFGNGAPLVSYLDLRHVVEAGREAMNLKFGVRYLLLPLVHQDTNWAVVRDSMYMLVSQHRGPYFIDLQEEKDEESDDVWVEPVGVYLIDSVVLEPPFLRLIIDPKMSRIKDRSRIKDFRNCEIPLHLTCAHVIRKQLMKAVRLI